MNTLLDFEKLGFRCGLEIHQQLATTKLFCRCATEDRSLDDSKPDFVVRRALRPTQSELGEVDAAARAEAERAKRFEYLGFHGLSCLVDADEEPPHEASREAVDVALTMALLFGSRVVDEVEWMRKIVIDGSNTSGFQRTGLVALGGRVDDVRIQTVALEEDSARRVGEAEGIVRYGLDRLGIPLIEIATEPDIRNPDHARTVAARIGALLRATGRVKRGIGTIRQDLNVSVSGGTRIEVKGVQELNAIPRVIQWEVRRQLRLIEIAKELASRGVKAGAIKAETVDVGAVFAKTSSKVVSDALRRGGVALAVRLPGFHGLIGSKAKDEPRLGRELADHARQDAGVRGLLHGDEMPTLGITAEEVAAVRHALGCGAGDSLLLVAAPRLKAERALSVAIRRAAQALEGVPREVRQAAPDDTNSYLRPMPGAARMYPETDVPPVAVSQNHLERLRASLPEPPERRVARLVKDHGLSQELAAQVVDEGAEATVLRWAEAAGDATVAARTLLATIPEIGRQHAGANVSDASVVAALAALRKGRFAKEGLAGVLAAMAVGQAASVEEAVATLGLHAVEAADVARAARELVAERADFVAERGQGAVGPLMGVLMQKFRGRADGQLVSRSLKEAVEAHLDRNPAQRRAP